MKTASRGIYRQRQRSGFMFILPALLLLVVFNIYPMLVAFYYSFFDVTIFLDNPVFVGLGNFYEAMADSRVWNGLKVTFVFTLFEVPFQMVIGLFLAALLTRNTAFNKLCRNIYFLPIVYSATAVAIMWRMFLNSNVGLLTYALELIGIKDINFLNTLGVTLGVLVFISVWHSFGISTVILLSAMQNVPTELYESARIDGCSEFKQFFKITLPVIRPTVTFVFVTRLIGSLQVFDLIFTTTTGGPNFTTESLVYYIYTRAFSTTNRLGYASAISLVLFAIILVFTIVLYTFMFSDREQRQGRRTA